MDLKLKSLLIFFSLPEKEFKSVVITIFLGSVEWLYNLLINKEILDGIKK